VSAAVGPVALGDGLLRELTTADLVDLQALLERAADYFLLHEGRATRATEASDVWAAVPDGIPRSNKRVLGLFAPGLCGVADVVCDWPRRGTWMIGLLLLDPAARGRAAGTRVIGAIDAAAAGAGADRLRIAVIPANVGGMRFWRRHGFEPVPAVGVHPTAVALERPVAGGA
jgi:GNAT superfamily N-acetyltransferase